MTPKEKAQELVVKYDGGGLKTFAGHDVKKISKQCASMEADKVIKFCLAEHIEYWKEVKAEIENYDTERKSKRVSR